MLNYFSYCNNRADDLIIQIMAKCGRDFQIRFSKAEKRRGVDTHRCAACDKIVAEGLHIVEKAIEGDRFYDLSEECGSYAATDLNPQGELIDLVGHFKNFVDKRKSRKQKFKTGAAQTCAKQETSEVILTKKSHVQKTEKK